MILEKIKTEGLAHLSYFVGDSMECVIIDPRRDCQVYIDIAVKHGMRISRIFETHRNEDFVVGSQELSERTGATIHHGEKLDFSYGETLIEGDSFMVGDLRLLILETPGHTYESISIVVKDSNFGEDPIAVFTGDTLFVGDVGRTDFFPEQAKEVAGLLYDSLINKLLHLGDQTIIYPAHGAGSVCGGQLASREFSTIGYERRNNPMLQFANQKEFIAHKVGEHHYKPPYFQKMEKYNQEARVLFPGMPQPSPMSAATVKAAGDGGALLVDLRSPEAYAGAFIPGSLALPLNLIPAYAGYLIDYEIDLILIPETEDQVDKAARHFFRLGYDCVTGYLKGGMHSWEVDGNKYDRIVAIHASEIDKQLKQKERFTLLDVRKIEEFKQSRLAGAKHIFLGELQDRIDEIDREKPVVTFCGSGMRAIVAASILKRHGFEEVENSLGSMLACKKIGCAIEEG